MSSVKAADKQTPDVTNSTAWHFGFAKLFQKQLMVSSAAQHTTTRCSIPLGYSSTAHHKHCIAYNRAWYLADSVARSLGLAIVIDQQM